jgi:hypothetical protein
MSGVCIVLAPASGCGSALSHYWTDANGQVAIDVPPGVASIVFDYPYYHYPYGIYTQCLNCGQTLDANLNVVLTRTLP